MGAFDILLAEGVRRGAMSAGGDPASELFFGHPLIGAYELVKQNLTVSAAEHSKRLRLFHLYGERCFVGKGTVAKHFGIHLDIP
uniref:hypothetical protein n=1 Tax=Halopelagius longus TaxID=1236180 RepID=UPI001C31354B|nr:hypothetical protein [Halopelagius longus]